MNYTIIQPEPFMCRIGLHNFSEWKKGDGVYPDVRWSLKDYRCRILKPNGGENVHLHTTKRICSRCHKEEVQYSQDPEQVKRLEAGEWH